MSQIKAIETNYNGYRFRSRLEARWAVFFDALGIRYKYEQYGFEKDGDENERYRWLPDFYLQDLGIWVEVKGGKPSAGDAEKMAHMLDYGSPLPFINNSANYGSLLADMEYLSLFEEMGGSRKYGYRFKPGLLLLGDVPYVQHGITIHPFITHYKGLHRGYGVFDLAGFNPMSSAEIYLYRDFSGYPDDQDDYLDAISSGSSDYAVEFFGPIAYTAKTHYAFTKVCKAYQAARSARFEHDECPAFS